MGAQFKILILALSFASSIAGAATCNFEASSGQFLIGGAYFGFNVADNGQVMDKKWFYATSNSGFATNEACVQSIAALKVFEKGEFCEVNWGAVNSKVMHEFNTLESRPLVAGCLKTLGNIQNSLREPFLMPSEIIELRKKLIARIGEKAVAVMTDRMVADQVAILRLK